jgi:hypothetical protein
MKKAVIILSAIAIIASGCGQATKKQAEITKISEEEQNASIIPSIQFDWEKAAILKNNTINELKKKEKTNDKIIMNFLNEYAKLVDEFNEILFKYEGYDSLNDLLYKERQHNEQYDLDLKKEVEANGFRLIYPEGMLELTQNTDFIKSEILSLVDAISKEFINLYCNEFDNRCCEDAAIIISKEELVNRVYKCGELSKKVAELEYKNHVEEEFYSNLYLLFFGIENTPSFDWETKKYNKEAIDFMNKVIKKNPTSRATEEFVPFIELFENENFKETQNVKDYWKIVKNKNKS